MALSIAAYRNCNLEAPSGEEFIAIIRRGPDLASFTFASTEDEAVGKAETFIAAEESKAAKYRKPKAATAEVEEAI